MRQARVPERVEEEVLALGVVGEELLAIAPSGDEVASHELRAVLRRRDAEERLALLAVLDERLEERAQRRLDRNLPTARARLRARGPLPCAVLSTDVDHVVLEVDVVGQEASERAGAQARVAGDGVEGAAVDRDLLARRREQREDLARVERRLLAVVVGRRRLYAAGRIVCEDAKTVTTPTKGILREAPATPST
jgi:hypothetical protein